MILVRSRYDVVDKPLKRRVDVIPDRSTFVPIITNSKFLVVYVQKQPKRPNALPKQHSRFPHSFLTAASHLELVYGRASGDWVGLLRSWGILRLGLVSQPVLKTDHLKAWVEGLQLQRECQRHAPLGILG
jgi:hypothetical protein